MTWGTKAVLTMLTLTAATLRKRVVAVLLVYGLAAGSASGAIIPIDETAIDTIFSQDSFGDTPVDINFLPSRTLYSPDHLDIDYGSGEHWELFNHPGNEPDPIVSMFFVDTIYWDAYWQLYGVAALPGNAFAIATDTLIRYREYDLADSTTKLIAHELGHSLGLEHVGDSRNDVNLMNSYLGYADTTLLESQVAQLLTSPLIQTDQSGNLFIDIRPIHVTDVAATVPEPPTYQAAIGLIVCFGLAGWWRKRKQAK